MNETIVPEINATQTDSDIDGTNIWDKNKLGKIEKRKGTKNNIRSFANLIHTIPSYAIIYTKTNKKVYDVSNRYIPTKREKTAQNTNNVRELTKVSSKIPQERDIIYKKHQIIHSSIAK